MCYKVSTVSDRKLRAYLQADVTVHEVPQYYHVSGFARPYLPVQLNTEPNVIQPARWKLLPFFVKTEADAAKYANTLNATCEDIFTKASYKNYITKHRGLLYVEGFYEPYHPDKKTSIPYYIYRRDGNPFTLGIVWAPWTDQETGEHYKTFSIITTPAAGMFDKIHNDKHRMPLIVGETERERWLSPIGKEEIAAMMVPHADADFAAHPVSREINKPGDHNVPESQLVSSVDVSILE